MIWMSDPHGFDSNQAHVELLVFECRHCLKQSRLGQDETSVYEWQHEHWEATGHQRFYRWSVTRNTSLVIGGTNE